MNKMIKRVFAGAMAAAVVLGGVAASPVSVKAADSYEAFLMFTDNNWGYGNWDSTYASTEVTGDGTYTVTLNASDVNDEATTGYTATTGILVFCVDIVGINLDDDGTTILENTTTLDDIHVYLDGEEVSVDTSAIITGDIEENGNFRIELRNEYGDTKAAPAVDENLSWSESISVTFTISNTGMTSDDSSSDDADNEEETTSDDADDSSNDADDSSSDDADDSSSGDDTTETGDVAPIAAVAVLLAGCAVILVASRKRA